MMRVVKPIPRRVVNYAFFIGSGARELMNEAKGIKRNLNFNRTRNSQKQHVSSAISTCFERDSDEKNGADCSVDGVYVLHSDSR